MREHMYIILYDGNSLSYFGAKSAKRTRERNKRKYSRWYGVMFISLQFFSSFFHQMQMEKVECILTQCCRIFAIVSCTFGLHLFLVQFFRRSLAKNLSCLFVQ